MDELGREPLVISCDGCAMRLTTACGDCVVSFVLDGSEHGRDGTGPDVALDVEQARVVRLLTSAGMLPDLRYRQAV